MKLYNFDTVLTFGQHKGETVAEALKNNPTYLEWCYAHIDDFYVTDAVWYAMDIHRNLEAALKSGGVDANEVRKAIANNKKLHEEKRTKYKKHMMDLFEKELELQLKGNSQSIEEDLPF
ncbi:hypothetical protein MWU50_10275 [Flavobacteriaceae bacterium S0862]|nr:hypothetical protein [Flavobacteriaceae bacterium S0862]